MAAPLKTLSRSLDDLLTEADQHERDADVWARAGHWPAACAHLQWAQLRMTQAILIVTATGGAAATVAAPTPVCSVPAGQCPVVQVPGCVYPAEVLVCAPKTVPATSEVIDVLIVFAVIVVGCMALRRKS